MYTSWANVNQYFYNSELNVKILTNLFWFIPLSPNKIRQEKNVKFCMGLALLTVKQESKCTSKLIPCQKS